MSRHEAIDYTIVRFADVSPDAILAKSGGRILQAALIFSPDDCRVARVGETSFIVIGNDGREQAAELAQAYEIRAFGPKAELRWIRDGESGTATLLADGEVPGQSVTGTTLDVICRTYRVWGEPPPASKEPGSDRARIPVGWSKLTTARIRALYVPDQAPGEVVLRAKEYVVRHETGNAVVLFERLVGFEAAPSRSPAREA
jgi:CRISPR-associated protein (TIGR03984 family)